jgi:hypothetical protein
VKKYKVMDAHSLIFQLNGKKKDDALTDDISSLIMIALL